MITRRTFAAGSLASAAAFALPLSARAETRSARIRTKDSTELHVQEWGSGPRAVILTHAWPLSAEIWDHQAAALAEAGYRVIAYDRRGFGRSGQPQAGYDFDTLADDLAAVIAETGARDITLVGYSMGGGEIVRYFSRHGGKHVVQGRPGRRRGQLPPEDRGQSGRPRSRRVRGHQAGRAGRPARIPGRPAAATSSSMPSGRRPIPRRRKSSIGRSASRCRPALRPRSPASIPSA